MAAAGGGASEAVSERSHCTLLLWCMLNRLPLLAVQAVESWSCKTCALVLDAANCSNCTALAADSIRACVVLCREEQEWRRLNALGQQALQACGHRDETRAQAALAKLAEPYAALPCLDPQSVWRTANLDMPEAH